MVRAAPVHCQSVGQTFMTDARIVQQVRHAQRLRDVKSPTHWSVVVITATWELLRYARYGAWGLKHTSLPSVACDNSRQEERKMSTSQSQWTIADIPTQEGKTALVTGANSGLGYVTSQILALRGAHVVMACRSSDKGERARHSIQVQAPHASLDVMSLDLSDLSTVRQFATEFGQQFRSLDMLINNAGVMALPRRTTADGFEMQFGTNHLGHFALTGLLADLLDRTAASRVVTVSSLYHRQGRIDFDNLMGKVRYRKWQAYAQSKLANLLFSYELQRYLDRRESSTISVAAHPGYANTNLQYAGPKMDNAPLRLRLMRMANSLAAQSAERGSLPILYAATAPDIAGGSFIGPDGFLQLRGYPVKVRSSVRSYDVQTARRLWEISEELTGVSFPPAKA